LEKVALETPGAAAQVNKFWQDVQVTVLLQSKNML
jgi:hypothetical protein